MEFVGAVSDDDGVAGVVAALEADDRSRCFRQVVGDFALAFIAPLGTNNNVYRHELKIKLTLAVNSLLSSRVFS
jgi:purine-nucleoside phosphorylase